MISTRTDDILKDTFRKLDKVIQEKNDFDDQNEPAKSEMKRGDSTIVDRQDERND